MRNTFLIAGIAMGALFASSASAATIDIISINGDWANPNPSSGITIVNDTGTDNRTNTMSWGTPATSAGQSSYVFEDQLTPIGGIVPEELFELGFFTHNNFPITSPFLGSADLQIDLVIDIFDDSNVKIGENLSVSSVFRFDHFETPNTADPCAAGGEQPCPDLVSFSLTSTPGTITIDDVVFGLTINGFSTIPLNLPDSFTEEFLTLENQENTAVLLASFSSDIPREVPTPGALPLLAIGAAAFGLALRRRRS